MSETNDNTRMQKEALKHMILEIHKGKAPEAVRAQLARLLGQVPYGLVVEVEQELIAEGLPVAEVQKLCDVHSAALKGVIEPSRAKTPPPGHPVDTFTRENRAIENEVNALRALIMELNSMPDNQSARRLVDVMQGHVNALMDVEKHYSRKENLLFPYLEKYGVTGPSKVMWGKDDEARGLLKAAVEALAEAKNETVESVREIVKLVLEPALGAAAEMIFKEEQILFPMCLDTLTETEWYEIYRQSREIGFCLVALQAEWEPGVAEAGKRPKMDDTRVQFPSGNMNLEELTAVLNTLPFDVTFVDKDDKVRFFTQGEERIFARSEAIIGRQVQHCHPPASVHIVEKIIADFKSGKQSRAPFWINLRGRFIHIEYFAVRDRNGGYLGTLEVTQDLTDLKKLDGEQRLLSYAGEGK